MKRPDLHLVHWRARRFARRAAAIRYRSVVVPLLHREETEFGLDLACKLAADRRAHVVLVAPLLVPQDLPLNAHFPAELAELRKRLDRGPQSPTPTASASNDASSAPENARSDSNSPKWRTTIAPNWPS